MDIMRNGMSLLIGRVLNWKETPYYRFLFRTSVKKGFWTHTMHAMNPSRFKTVLSLLLAVQEFVGLCSRYRLDCYSRFPEMEIRNLPFSRKDDKLFHKVKLTILGFFTRVW